MAGAADPGCNLLAVEVSKLWQFSDERTETTGSMPGTLWKSVSLARQT